MAEGKIAWTTEKLTERLQLRVGEGMKREILALAELEERSVEDEARHIMRLGLEIKRTELGNGVMGAVCHLLCRGPGQPVQQNGGAQPAPPRRAEIVSRRPLASAKKASGGAA